MHETELSVPEEYAEEVAEPLQNELNTAFKLVEEYERRARACGCARCHSEARRMWEVFVDNWIVPDEERECVRRDIEKYAPRRRTKTNR